jgi:nucleoid-associated protein YgaU
MTRIQKTALLAFVLLLAVAAVGAYLGGGKAAPADAEPATVVLETDGMATIQLLPKERRRAFQAEDFVDPPAQHPLQPGSGRAAGEDHVPPRPLAGAGGTSSGTAANASYKTIRVRQGQTLSGIARRELGDPDRYREIMRLNDIEDERQVRVGQELLIPRAGGAAAAANPSTRSSGELPMGGARYTVQQGDVLGRIALRFYGDKDAIQPILDANGLRDANQIRAGQDLIIPPRPR